MLKNAERNAEPDGLDADSLVIEHTPVNKVPKIQHRTYRSPGQINPHRSSPCHMERILPKKSRWFLN